jgi:hypothetical protein
MRQRSLTLHDVPDDLLAEVGLARGGATTVSYSCTDAAAFLTTLGELVGPIRMLNREALVSILCGIRDGTALPPVVVFREPGATKATLLDGLHRWRASSALGFSAIPCTQPSRDDAKLCYRYTDPVRYDWLSGSRPQNRAVSSRLRLPLTLQRVDCDQLQRSDGLWVQHYLDVFSTSRLSVRSYR